MTVQPVAHPQELRRTKPKYQWSTSFGDWLRHLWSKDFSDSAVEKRLLSYLPFYPESDGKREGRIIDTDLDDGTYIHEFCVANVEKQDPSRDLATTSTVKDIVLVHGYAASLGLFLENFGDLSSIPGVHLHTIDLPGFGLSARPKFPNLSADTKEEIYQNEDWFIDRLEQWRKKRGIERFVLVGHSLGGYLSCAYTMKYNRDLVDAATGVSHRIVEKLVLVSPAGLERHKDALGQLPAGRGVALSEEMPRPIQEVITDQEDIVHGNHAPRKDCTSSSLRKDTAVVSTADTSVDLDTEDASGETPLFTATVSTDERSKAVSMVKWMWEHNFSPFSIVRNIGPARSKMISMWTSRRFSHVYYADPIKFQSMHDYFYRIFNGKGSGEFAATRLLGWGAMAKLPLLDRCPDKFVKMNLPTLWLYGDRDWMNNRAGLSMTKEINELALKNAKGILAYFDLVPSAGHHLYLDNPQTFARVVFEFLDV